MGLRLLVGDIHSGAAVNASMGLLAEIRDAAVDESSNVEPVLRKCLILASKLKHEELKTWVNRELDGYPDGAALPSYRKCRGACAGNLYGFGRGIRSHPIPASSFPDKIRGRWTHVEFRQGVGELTNLVQERDSIQYLVPSELYGLIRPKNVADDLVLGQAWINISKTQIIGILSTIRNRILKFTLEIEDSYPDAGDAAPGTSPVPKEFVNQVFNNTFYGPVGNVASGHGIQQTSTINIQQGDFRQLAAYLEGQGVEKEDIKDLEIAIREDPQPTGGTFGKKVGAWMGKMVSKAATGAWKVGTDVAANVITKALERHYGLPPSA